MPRVSADLMFGMPDQTLDELAEDIAQIAEPGIQHVSAYALTIEEKTTFGSLHRAGKLRVAPEEQYAELFEHAERCFSDLGWTHYEVSNYAAPDEESPGTIFTTGAAARTSGSALRRSAASIEGPGRARDGETIQTPSDTCASKPSKPRSNSSAPMRSFAKP